MSNLIVNKVNVSDLKGLNIGGELVVKNELCTYGFTKLYIFENEYLVFGTTGGIDIETMSAEYASEYDYEIFRDKINKKYDIKLEIVFDINIES